MCFYIAGKNKSSLTCVTLISESGYHHNPAMHPKIMMIMMEEHYHVRL